jgi:hypothetical protein
MSKKIYRINLSGIGGEICTFNISEDAYNFWNEQDQEDLESYIFTGDINIEYPLETDFMDRDNVEPEWYDHPEEIEHLTGVSYYNGFIGVEEVEKADMDAVAIIEIIDGEKTDDFFQSHEDLIWNEKDEVEKGKFVCSAMSIEKGRFFEGYLELEEDFDKAKLNLEITSLPNDESIITEVFYDGKIVEGDFISTNGKGYYGSLAKGY